MHNYSCVCKTIFNCFFYKSGHEYFERSTWSLFANPVTDIMHITSCFLAINLINFT